MKTVFAITLPACSEHFRSALTEAFRASNHPVDVTLDQQQDSFASGQLIEHLQSPIDPAGNTCIVHLHINDAAALSVINKTLLDEQFVIRVAKEILRTDLFALECLVTSCIGREITQTYLIQTKVPSKVMRCAAKTAAKNNWIEQTLGTPSALDLLNGFADDLIARGTR